MEVDGATTLWAEWPVLPQITWILMGEANCTLQWEKQGWNEGLPPHGLAGLGAVLWHRYIWQATKRPCVQAALGGWGPGLDYCKRSLWCGSRAASVDNHLDRVHLPFGFSRWLCILSRGLMRTEMWTRKLPTDHCDWTSDEVLGIERDGPGCLSNPNSGPAESSINHIPFLPGPGSVGFPLWSCPKKAP